MWRSLRVSISGLLGKLCDEPFSFSRGFSPVSADFLPFLDIDLLSKVKGGKPKKGSGPMKKHVNPALVSQSAASLPKIP